MSDSNTVVIIDDDPFIRELLKSVFKSLGHDIEAFDSATALPCINGNCEEKCLLLDPPPKLLITDIKMPGMTGIQLLKEIHKKDGKHLPLGFETMIPNAHVSI